jgi:hypothetical protein
MAKVNWNDIPDSDDFSPLEPGRYLMEITKVDDEKTTNDGDEKWLLTLECVEGDRKGRKVWDSLIFSEGGLKRMKLIFSRLGMKIDGEVEFFPKDLIGKRALIDVEIQEDNPKFNTVPYAGWNKVDGSAPASKAKSGKASPPPEEDDEELPF